MDIARKSPRERGIAPVWTRIAAPIIHLLRSFMPETARGYDKLAFGREHAVLPPPVDPLSPQGVAEATAKLMWRHRDALDVNVMINRLDDRWNVLEGDESCLPTKRTHVVTIPGGINVTIDENVREYHTVRVATPSGHVQNIAFDDAESILLTWICIQSMAILEAWGFDTGEYEDPVDLRWRLAQLAGDMLAEREMDPLPGRCKYDELALPNQWLDMGGAIGLGDQLSCRFSLGLDDTPSKRLLHPVMGIVTIPPEPIQEGMNRYKRRMFADALGIAETMPTRITPPRGNARAARILRLCSDAIEANPKMTDVSGTALAPLVTTHLPELMRIHARAASSAPADQLEAIDTELMEGIERVRRAVEEGLSIDANEKRDELRKQLRFLELRHPDRINLQAD